MNYKNVLLIPFLAFSFFPALGYSSDKSFTINMLKNIFSLQKINENNCIGLMSIESDITQAKSIIKTLMHIENDTNIKGLILHLNSTGGSIGSSQAIFSHLKKFKTKKPIVVIIENRCLSGAYYVAIAADCIIANAGSEIGSIGIVILREHYKNLKLNEKSGDLNADLDMEVLGFGTYKNVFNPYTPFKNHHKEYLNAIGQKLYDQFVAHVAHERNLNISEEKVWADGKVFIGQEALELGLIDMIGDFSDAVEKIKELLRKRGYHNQEKIKLVDIKQS